MSFGVDASQNYLTWGNIEAITYTSVAGHSINGAGGGNITSGNNPLPDRFDDEDFPIAVAKPRAINFKELVGSGGVYKSHDRVWLIPKAMIDQANADGDVNEFNTPRGLPFSEYPFEPKPADRITDEDETVWTILEASLNTLKSTWRCVTRNLVIAEDLRHELSIKRPGVVTDNAGGRDYSTYTTIYRSIACRFQEQNGSITDERGQRATSKTYIVPVDRRLYLKIEDIAVDQAGNIYEIKGWHDADQIGSLMQLECERRWA